MDALFAFDTSPLELVLRGTLMYWFLWLVFRFVLRRDAGAVGIADILFVVIVADASQNAFSGSYSSVAEGMLLVATLVAWNVLMDWGSLRWPLVRRFMEPRPVPLILRGRLIKRNLRQEFLTPEDIEAQLRLHDIASVSDVKEAYMESDGKCSFVTYRGDSRPDAAPSKEVTPGG